MSTANKDSSFRPKIPILVFSLQEMNFIFHRLLGLRPPGIIWYRLELARNIYFHTCVCVLLAQSCATLCNPKMLLMFLNFKLNSYSTMDKWIIQSLPICKYFSYEDTFCFLNKGKRWNRYHRGFTQSFEVSLKQQNLSILFYYVSIYEPSNSCCLNDGFGKHCQCCCYREQSVVKAWLIFL